VLVRETSYGLTAVHRRFSFPPFFNTIAMLLADVVVLDLFRDNNDELSADEGPDLVRELDERRLRLFLPVLPCGRRLNLKRSTPVALPDEIDGE
jgi:hypothetical protein